MQNIFDEDTAYHFLEQIIREENLNKHIFSKTIIITVLILSWASNFDQNMRACDDLLSVNFCRIYK